jgi:histone-lysine N-methyltransferase SETMAR
LEKIERIVFEILPHPPYSPYLAPSDYHIFGLVKNHMRDQYYETIETLQTAVRQCFRAAGTEFEGKGIFKLPERWEKCVQRNGDGVEK